MKFMSRLPSNKAAITIMTLFCILIYLLGISFFFISNSKYNVMFEDQTSSYNKYIKDQHNTLFLTARVENLSEENANLAVNDENIGISTFNMIDQYYSLSSKEKELAITYPFETLKVKDCASLAAEMANKFYIGNELYLGNGDAFRHAYWNALMVKELGIDFAEVFATAHESDTPDGKDKQMDLRNNSYGRWDGEKYKYLSKENLAIKIKELVTNGQYVRIINSRIVATNGMGLKEVN